MRLLIFWAKAPPPASKIGEEVYGELSFIFPPALPPIDSCVFTTWENYLQKSLKFRHLDLIN